MKKLKSKDARLCILTMVIAAGSYAAEKLIEIYIHPSFKLGIILALISLCLMAAVIAILAKTKDAFFSLLAGLFGYKMMPVPILFLGNVSQDANMIYYLVKQASVIVFAALIYRAYCLQEKPRAIKPLPLLALMAATPFFTQIGGTLTGYFDAKTGSMLFGYLSQYACYALAAVVILAVAYVSGYESMRFTAYFEYVALGINFLRVAGKILIKLIYQVHISKSLYIWLVLYAVLAACFFIAKDAKRKNVGGEIVIS